MHSSIIFCSHGFVSLFIISMYECSCNEDPMECFAVQKVFINPSRIFFPRIFYVDLFQCSSEDATAEQVFIRFSRIIYFYFGIQGADEEGREEDPDRANGALGAIKIQAHPINRVLG